MPSAQEGFLLDNYSKVTTNQITVYPYRPFWYERQLDTERKIRKSLASVKTTQVRKK